jgi:glycerol-3-phosphate acyltransferase PlsY
VLDGWVGVLLAGLLGYLLGAVPAGVLVCRALGAPDARTSGSGHTGGLNVSRLAGLPAGALTAVADALLGLAAVVAAHWLAGSPWAATAAGVMAVVGHNWSAYIRFAGGIGLAKLFGAQLGASPLPALEALAILLPLWLILMLPLRVHRARSTILVMLAVGPLLWALKAPWPAVWLGALSGGVVILKTLPDWNREYG